MVEKPLAKSRTVERCETYLDSLADLIAAAGKDWVVYRPLVERLERETNEAREEKALYDRMLGRKSRDDLGELISPLPRRVWIASPLQTGALNIAQLWARAMPGNTAVSADDKRYLMMLCRNRTGIY